MLPHFDQLQIRNLARRRAHALRAALLRSVHCARERVSCSNIWKQTQEGLNWLRELVSYVHWQHIREFPCGTEPLFLSGWRETIKNWHCSHRQIRSGQLSISYLSLLVKQPHDGRRLQTQFDPGSNLKRASPRRCPRELGSDRVTPACENKRRAVHLVALLRVPKRIPFGAGPRASHSRSRTSIYYPFLSPPYITWPCVSATALQQGSNWGPCCQANLRWQRQEPVSVWKRKYCKLTKNGLPIIF